MLRTVISILVLGLGSAVYALLFRERSCEGNCGGCGAGSCELKEGGHHS